MGTPLRSPRLPIVVIGSALGWLLLAGSSAGAVQAAEVAARDSAVKQIMAQIEDVRLDLEVTTRDLFDAAPVLRKAALRVVREAARKAPVAPHRDGGSVVDVVVAGDLLEARLEEARAKADLPPGRLRTVSLRGLSGRGRRFSATGRGTGGVTIPPAWRKVSERDRALAVSAARTEALAHAARELAAEAKRRDLPGGALLAALLSDDRWVREAASDLRRLGATDVGLPEFLDDGRRCKSVVRLPAAALLGAIVAQGGVAGLPEHIRKTIARGLTGVVAKGEGIGVVPETPAAGDRPRVLRSRGEGRAAEGTSGERAWTSAARAARTVALARLADQLRRVRLDSRRSVADLVRADSRAGERLDAFIIGAREISSGQLPGSRWYVERELNLDGLDAALRGR